MVFPRFSLGLGRGPRGRLAAHFQRHELGQTAAQGVTREVKPGAFQQNKEKHGAHGIGKNNDLDDFWVPIILGKPPF